MNKGQYQIAVKRNGCIVVWSGDKREEYPNTEKAIAAHPAIAKMINPQAAAPAKKAPAKKKAASSKGKK